MTARKALTTSTGQRIANIGQAHPPVQVVAAGQSLLTIPPRNVFTVAMEGITGVSWINRGVPALSWTILTSGYDFGGGNIIPPATDWTYPYLIGALNLLVLLGGTSDISAEANDGATAYADLCTYADAGRAAGADLVIAGTITPSTTFLPGVEPQRIIHNNLLLANTGGHFDGVFDVSVPPLDNPADTQYYADGLHWTAGEYGTATGVGVAAPIIRAAVETAIP